MPRVRTGRLVPSVTAGMSKKKEDLHRVTFQRAMSGTPFDASTLAVNTEEGTISFSVSSSSVFSLGNDLEGFFSNLKAVQTCDYAFDRVDRSGPPRAIFRVGS